MLDDIPDDELRRRLRNFEEQPDDDLWNKLEGEITPPVRPLSEQLKNYTEVPDETVWKGIERAMRVEVATFRMTVATGILSLIALLMLLFPLAINSPHESVTRYSLNENSSGSTVFPTDSSESISDASEGLTDNRASQNIKNDNQHKKDSFNQEVHADSVSGQLSDNETTITSNTRKALSDKGDERNVDLIVPLEEKKSSTRVAQNSLEEKKNDVSSDVVISSRQDSGDVSNDVAKKLSIQQNDDPNVIRRSGLNEKPDSEKEVKYASEEKNKNVHTVVGIDQKEDLNQKVVTGLRDNQQIDFVDQSVTGSGKNITRQDSVPVNNKADHEQIAQLPADTLKTDSIVVAAAVREKQKPSELIREKPKREKSRSPLGIYALVMPTLGYQEVRPLKQDNIFIESVDRVSAFSSKRLGIRGEVGIERTLSGGWSVNAGVLYYQRKQSITYQYNDGSHVDVIELPGDSMTFGVRPRTFTGTFEYQVMNIGALAGFNYSIKGKQFEQRVGMSGEVHKPLSRDEDAGGRSVYLFANAYYRLSYRLSKRFDLMLQPTFNYSLQVDNRTDAPFYVKPYGLGLNFGAFYHF